jgi:hypothetical protein
MFSDYTDEQITCMKKEITAFLRSNLAVQTVSDDSGNTLTLNQANAFRFLEELTKEQKRRKRGGNPFIAMDLR